eukprot:TRINITY_DN6018_c0_g1_i1.p1 TRINITY_DN6018_c0_g1~~TRINITY_DN6018_c0_g1_i1.p1  ORF type:complete len:812 (+),score=171.06 TRINITY_DN6018_c0_g1_i1:83-2437(+)
MSEETTRVRVVGLPNKVDVKRLKELFGGCGEVTDCAVIKNQTSGRPRMAFLGYKTTEQAAAAVKKLNKAFLGTSRLTVEFAVRYGDEEANKKAWSKHTKKKLQAEQEKKRAAELAAIEARKAEHELQKAQLEKQNRLKNKNKEDSVKAFLEIGKASTRQIWDNDMEGPGDIQANEEDSASDDGSSSHPEPDTMSLNSEDELERQQRLNTMSDLDFFKSKQKSKEPSSPTQSPSKRPKTEEDPSAVASVKKTPKRQSTIQVNDIPKIQKQEDEDAEASIMDSGRLFVSNIPFSATEDELRTFFEKLGPVAEAHVPVTRDSKQSKGVAFIQYSIPEDAVRAFKQYSGACFQGRLIIISPGKANPFETEETSNAKSSYKKMKELKLKAESGNANTWNSVFMSGDTVAATLSKRLNVEKSELLDVNTSDIATRLAMGEAHLTTEVKDIFSQEGLDIQALTDSSRVKARSDRVILVKNLPKNTKIHDITSLFDAFGAVERVVAPPETTIALVSYITAQEAKVAFRKLAFRPFNKVPLFLEWAPVGALQDVDSKIKDQQREDANKQKDKPSPVENPTPDASDIYNTDKNILYITNIAFNVSLSDFERLVKSCVAKAKYVVSINLPIDTERKSKGFAFVEFRSHKIAAEAMKQLQGRVLMQRNLSVEFAKDKKSKVTSSEDCPEGSNPLKLTIKNVPFEATRKDIANLFAAFSQVKSVRLPRKAIGASDTGAAKRPHRGFAFVEFTSAQEAATAKQKLSNTHIYSRHLVIEYAKMDDAVGSAALHDRDQVD